MPVLLDLDNTLVDRDGAFAHWAADAVRSWGGDLPDVEWLIRADAHGYTPRAALASMIIDRLQPDTADVDDLVTRLLYEHVDHIECYPGVLTQLGELAEMGQRLVIVTNGGSRQQRMKIERTGLSDIVAGSAISGELDCKKPDPRIFTAALEIAGSEGAAWMVGDHVDADMTGARAASLATAWVTHGRPWTEQWAPTLTGRTTSQVLASIATALRSTI
ncbi:HAD family hydrolase [Gordonia sp. ABSL11-1]|uniref:HAD family hydrolase n=1 Tax=Gordonia sp. ABSL11-1 TaxID=3053924 RepID=UPI002572B751|nr:HAD family hydrolase [Gordonia sp. ABSL11-1]MDL9947928.1 HAD family hydrolase [Gordonia sp. ABSL11-1]